MAGQTCAAHWSLKAHAPLVSLVQHLVICLSKPHLSACSACQWYCAAAEAKAEQVAVRSARYDSLQVDLAEAQTQLAAHCAHFQVNASLLHFFMTIIELSFMQTVSGVYKQYVL